MHERQLLWPDNAADTSGRSTAAPGATASSDAHKQALQAAIATT